ncbi:MAG: hypothetical protein BWX64_00778 [Acidobacteria bacterium ADurb.Bin051]|nr:MAG: hypothetical protein BWX64_00778 [Acidobacteria bacterium ADurb.Bin051]
MGGDLSVAEEERGRRHGSRLAEVTIDHDLGVSTIASHDVKKLDPECLTKSSRSLGNRLALRRSGAAVAPAGEVAGLEAVGEEAGIGPGEDAEVVDPGLAGGGAGGGLDLEPCEGE